MGNHQVRFLGEGAEAMPFPYMLLKDSEPRSGLPDLLYQLDC